MMIASLLLLFGQAPTPFYSPTIGGMFDEPDIPDPCVDTPVLPEKVWFCPPAPVEGDYYWVVDQACKAQAEADYLAAAQACYDAACELQGDAEDFLTFCNGVAQTISEKLLCVFRYEELRSEMILAWANCLHGPGEAFLATDCCVKVYP